MIVMSCIQFETIYIGLIFILLGVNLTLQFHDVNVVYLKHVEVCDSDLLVHELTDGDKEGIIEVAGIPDCDEQLTITLLLGAMYFIQCVIVFPGNITVETDHPLDHFEVKLTHPGEKECGTFTKSLRIISDFSKGLRINCKKSETANKAVHFVTKNKDTVYITEVEVYTLGSGGPIDALYAFRGCFSEFTFRSEHTFSGIFSCRYLCMNNGTPIMALSKPLDKCLCGITFDETREVSMATCSTICAGVNKTCGGSNAYSVYILRYQIPYFMGCTSAVAPNDKMETIVNITIGKCMKHCHDSSNVWIKGDSCVCFNGNMTSDVASECNNRCSGDPSSVCGGVNHATVYATCKDQSNIYLSCKKLLHCIDDDYDEYGVCLRGCTEGFSGTYCIERETYNVTVVSAQFQTSPTIDVTSSTINVSMSSVRKEKASQTVRVKSNFVIQLAIISLLLNFI